MFATFLGMIGIGMVGSPRGRNEVILEPAYSKRQVPNIYYSRYPWVVGLTGVKSQKLYVFARCVQKPVARFDFLHPCRGDRSTSNIHVASGLSCPSPLELSLSGIVSTISFLLIMKPFNCQITCLSSLDL